MEDTSLLIEDVMPNSTTRTIVALHALFRFFGSKINQALRTLVISVVSSKYSISYIFNTLIAFS